MIAEIGRTQIRLRFSFVALVTLMLYFCDERVVLSAFFASLFHESGHLILMYFSGASVKKIEFGAFGIRIDRAETSLLSYKKEGLIALGGIIFNLGACLILSIVNVFYPSENLMLFSAVNLLVALINSIPNGFLDFGRALHFFLLSFLSEDKAESIIRKISAAFTALLTVFWLCYSLFVKLNISLTAVTIYLIAITFKRKVD